MKIKPSGDKGVLISFGNDIEEEINKKVISFTKIIEEQNSTYIEEVIPSYNKVLVIYNPLLISYIEICKNIKVLHKKISKIKSYNSEIIHIPVFYGEEYGADIEFVAKHNNLSVDDVIRIHTEKKYLIYMIGFTPGFPYLGGMSKLISTPRLEKPRQKIRAGSVGIAGNQTGIYPIESPGGWRLIGHTPLNIFNIKEEPPVLFKAGQYIKFESVTKKEYEKIAIDVKNGDYKLVIMNI